MIQTNDPLVAADQNHEIDDYLQSADGSLDWISQPTASFATKFAYPSFYSAGATNDLGHVLFEDTTRRVAAAAGLDEYAYGLYESTDGTLRLVDVDSGGALISPYGAGLGAGVGYKSDHAISSDGERIYFTTPSSIEPAPPPYDVRRIYLRESGATTTEISASQCTQPSCQGPVQDAEYQGAAVDGSVAFFTSHAQLTNDSTPGGGLYRYDVGDGELTLLTADATDPGGAAVEGEVANSDDGSIVYFVAQGKLAAGATSGSDNLYVYDATTEATTFVATLDPSDFYLWNGSAIFKPAEVTPSGDDFVFRTPAPLSSGYDNAGHYEIYRYDAPTRNLDCVSCLPIGSSARSDVSFAEINGNLEHNISDDGSRVFFQTADPLVSADENTKLDVYGWHDGTVSLISSGTSNADSQFGSATASGGDVLFSSWQRLAPSDNDEHLDVYDARVNGGIPPPPSTPQSAICSGSDCRGSGSENSTSPTPGSAAFTAAKRGPETFRVSAISSSEAKRWARTGRLALRVKVSGPGRVAAVVSGRLGKRSTTVARASTRARASGTVSLTLRLSKTARSYLERHGRLPLKVAVTYSKASVTKRTQVTLRRADTSPQAGSRGQR